MENVNVAKIDKNNPCAKSYLKKVNKIDEGLKLPFYAIYLGDIYKAAMVVNLEKENRKAIIKTINFSSSDQSIFEEATRKLTSLLNSNNDIENIEVNSVPVKVISM